MSVGEAIILGIVQGITEFLPISSSGHLILARELFGISTAYGLSVDAILQLATAVAIFIYFRKDFFGVARVGLQSVAWVIFRLADTLSGGYSKGDRSWMILRVSDGEKNVFIALVLGTIPAVLAGLLLESSMETIFRSAELVAWVLLIGSGLFLLAEFAAKRYQSRGIRHNVTPLRGLTIGFFQALALIPGFSRSGATISGGLLLGLSREEAARFGFLLAFPILLGSGLKKMEELYITGAAGVIGYPLVIGAVVAFVVGLLTIHFLLQYLRKHTLLIFVIYRVILAVVVLVYVS